MSELCCSVCGSSRNVQVLAGLLLCKTHRDALPRHKCAAVLSSGAPKFVGLKRCQQTAFGDDLLCAGHQAVGAEVLQWELCPKCRQVERIVGGQCHHCDI